MTAFCCHVLLLAVTIAVSSQVVLIDLKKLTTNALILFAGCQMPLQSIIQCGTCNADDTRLI